MTEISSPTDRVVIDAHVHVHDCYRLADFFDSAWTNLAAAAAAAGRSGAKGSFVGVLAFTETADDDYFGRFAGWAAAPAQAPGHEVLGGWSFHATGERAALVARNGDRELRMIAGRQVACMEDLEVLAIGTRSRFEDGRPIRETLERVRADNALPVIPWGPGKWFLGRGRLLSALIQSAPAGELYLGDEGGRPIFWPTPRHFGEAQRHGLRVLPGTDPLPFPTENGRAGSYGFWMDAPLDLDRPSESLKARLREGDAALHPFGRREWPVPFVRNQIAMQLRKQRRKGLAARSAA